MTEDFVIHFDRHCSKLFLNGSFLKEYDKFRQASVAALYMKSNYDELKPEELKAPRTVEFVMSNCLGGGIADTFALIALLRMFKRELPNVTFTILCCGVIQSAATIFMTCDVFAKVLLDKYCDVKIHNVETTFEKKPGFKKRCFDLYAEETRETEQTMCQHYARFAALRGKTGTDWQKVIDDGNTEKCLTPEKVLELGLCDEVV